MYRRFYAAWLGAALAVGSTCAHAFSPDDLVTSEVVINYDTGFGYSSFLSGSVPELGAGDVTIAPKLTWNAGNIWRARIGLPPASTFTTQFYRRADGPGDIGNAANGTPLGAEETTTTQAHPSANLPASKTLYYRSGWTSINLMVENASTPGTYTGYPMSDVGAGRSAGERLWRTSGFGTPGRAVRFYLQNNLGATDPAGGATTPYQTFIDAGLLQDGHLFNDVPAATVSASRIEVIANVASPQGLLARSLRVYLPRGYDEHTTRHYPVLYMHDGNTIYGTSGSGFPTVRWNVDGSFNDGIKSGNLREVIVVGIDNTSQRLSDYTPPGAPASGLQNGQGDKYAAYVGDTVKPLIDATYRTLPDAANTGVAGCSLGGLISTYMALEHPGTYTRIGAFSPAYWANPTATVDRFPNEPTLPEWRHFMSCGTVGGGSDPDGYYLTIASRDALLRRGQVFNVHVYNVIGVGEQHNEQAWQNRFPGAMRYLFPIEDEESDFSSLQTSVRDWKLF